MPFRARAHSFAKNSFAARSDVEMPSGHDLASDDVDVPFALDRVERLSFANTPLPEHA